MCNVSQEVGLGQSRSGECNKVIIGCQRNSFWTLATLNYCRPFSGQLDPYLAEMFSQFLSLLLLFLAIIYNYIKNVALRVPAVAKPIRSLVEKYHLRQHSLLD